MPANYPHSVYASGENVKSKIRNYSQNIAPESPMLRAGKGLCDSRPCAARLSDAVGQASPVFFYEFGLTVKSTQQSSRAHARDLFLKYHRDRK
jgi:hypothetical protein